MVRYLVCSRAKRGLGCHFITWPYEDCERLVMVFMRDVDFGALSASDEASVKRAALEQAIATAEGKQADCRRRIAQLLAAVEEESEDGKKDLPRSVVSRLRSLEAQEADAGAELSRAQKELSAHAGMRNPQERKRDLLSLMQRMTDADPQAKFALRARLAAEIRSLYEAIELYPGGYFMSEAEWTAFSEGLTEKEIEAEGLEQLKSPSKSMRWAVVHGKGGSRIATYNRREAQTDRRPELAALEVLGVEY